MTKKHLESKNGFSWSISFALNESVFGERSQYLHMLTFWQLMLLRVLVHACTHSQILSRHLVASLGLAWSIIESLKRFWMSFCPRKMSLPKIFRWEEKLNEKQSGKTQGGRLMNKFQNGQVYKNSSLQLPLRTIQGRELIFRRSKKQMCTLNRHGCARLVY